MTRQSMQQRALSQLQRGLVDVSHSGRVVCTATWTRSPRR
jgi:hypothetical protein